MITLRLSYNRGLGKTKIDIASPQIPSSGSQKWIQGGLYITTLLGLTWIVGSNHIKYELHT